jgi:hypothetical protein
MAQTFGRVRRCGGAQGIGHRGRESLAWPLRGWNGPRDGGRVRWRAWEPCAVGRRPPVGASLEPDGLPEPRECPSTRPTLESLRGYRSPTLPGLRLMLAVLDDGLETLFATAGRRPGLWADTVSWVIDDDTQWPFSFVNLCEALDVDAARLRRRLAPWLGVAYPPLGSAPHRRTRRLQA